MSSASDLIILVVIIVIGAPFLVPIVFLLAMILKKLKKVGVSWFFYSAGLLFSIMHFVFHEYTSILCIGGAGCSDSYISRAFLLALFLIVTSILTKTNSAVDNKQTDT